MIKVTVSKAIILFKKYFEQNSSEFEKNHFFHIFFNLFFNQYNNIFNQVFEK